MELWVSLELFSLRLSVENMALRVFQISTGPFRGVVIPAGENYQDGYLLRSLPRDPRISLFPLVRLPDKSNNTVNN